MMFWVKNAPLTPAEEEQQDRSRTPAPDRGSIADAFGKVGMVVKRSIDGKNFVREHLVFAKL